MAHNNIGLIYEEGRGVRQDYAQAYMRYSLAISLSNPNPGTGIQNLNSLIERLTSAQIAQAKRLAREWWQEYPSRHQRQTNRPTVLSSYRYFIIR